MEYISTFLANRMCKQDVIREDDRAYYAYSIQLMLEKTIGLFLICIFAFVFKAFWEIMSFLIVFALLRSHSDGFHCKTSLGCFALSVITALSTIPVSNLIRYAPGICQGGGDIVNDNYILHWNSTKPGLESIGQGVRSP